MEALESHTLLQNLPRQQVSGPKHITRKQNSSEAEHSFYVTNLQVQVSYGGAQLKPLKFCVLFFFNVYLFLRERERMSREGAGRKGQRICNQLSDRRQPDVGLERTNVQIVT